MGFSNLAKNPLPAKLLPVRSLWILLAEV